ncbi:MAG TPA: FAD-dependent oxidoreductase [Gemmatimonadaceae bacterium]|jgi:protoporphyrinogen oxidase|nr:FAD-dependent oxidoreductase [Gemmatimonadaceae bacterium]
MTDRRHLVVIGGGFAGIAAAVRLREHGARVTMLERAPTLGGRARSDDFGGVTIDTGAQLLSTMCTRTLHLLGEDRHAMLRPARGRDAYVRAGVHYPLQFGSLRSLLAFGGIGAMDKMRLARYVLPILATHARALDAGAAHVTPAHDAVDARTFIAQHIGDEAADVLVEPPLNGFYALRGNETALAFFLMLGRYGGEGDVLEPVAGWSATLDRVLHGVVVERGTTVTAIHRDGAALDVQGESGRSWRANGVVVATSPHQAAALLAGLLPSDAEMPDWLRGIPLRQTWTLALALDTPMPRDAFGLFHDAAQSRVVSACAVCGARSRTGWRDRDVVLAWPTPGAVHALPTASADERTRAMLPEVEALIPAVRGHITRARLYSFAEGSPIPEPGFAASRARGRAFARELARAPGPMITVAGDYLTVPLIEGAVASGEHAAALILSRSAP